LLVPPRDLNALESAVALLADDAALRERLARAGRQRAQEMFAIDKYLDKCEGYYRELL
jgi:glycosyltransferase involved in cell wall biosynthesis